MWRLRVNITQIGYTIYYHSTDGAIALSPRAAALSAAMHWRTACYGCEVQGRLYYYQYSISTGAMWYERR